MSRHDHHAPSEGDAEIARAASDWIARLDRGLTAEEAKEFAAWEKDPRHAGALERLNETWRALDTADEVPDIMRLAHEVERRQQRRAASRRRRPWIMASLAAAAVAAVIWTPILRPAARFPRAAVARAQDHSYRILPSAARHITLPDGSVAEVKAGGSIAVEFSRAERRVRLVRGEAQFTVAKNPARPFIVHAGRVAVRAVGTEFNVNLAAASIEVIVTEGQVRVDHAADGKSLLKPADRNGAAAEPLLTAGQHVVIAAAAPQPVAPTPIAPADIARALAWRGTQLVFDRTPLDEVAAAFNHYNRRQLVLVDPALRARRLGGSFQAKNLDAFVRMLQAGFDITAEPRGDGEILLRAGK